MRFQATLTRVLAVLAFCAGLALTTAAPGQDSDAISDFIDPALLPSNFLVPDLGMASLADDVGLQNIATDDYEDGGQVVGTKITGELTLPAETKFAVPGLDILSLILKPGTGTLSFELRIRDAPVEGTATNAVELEVQNVKLLLRVTSDLIRPVKKDTAGHFSEYNCTGGECVDSANNPVYVEMEATGTLVLKMDWDGGFDFDIKQSSGHAAEFSITHPFTIAKSGVILEVGKVALDLSETKTPAVCGFDGPWKGVCFDSAAIHFGGALKDASFGSSDPNAPDPDATSLTFEHLAIGEGGASFKVSGKTTKAIKIGSSTFTLDDVMLEMRQNEFVQSRLSGKLANMPFFDQPVGLDVSVTKSGKVLAAIAADRGGDPLKTFHVANVMDFEIDSMGVDFDDDLVVLTINGGVTPKFPAGVKINTASGTTRIAIEGLELSSNGRVRLREGLKPLPQQATFTAYQLFTLNINKFAFGSEADSTAGNTAKHQWMQFSGKVTLAEGVGKGSFNDLRFEWDKSLGPSISNFKASVKGVGIEVEKAEVISLKGTLNSFEDAVKGDGFRGLVDVKLPKLGVNAAADVLIGTTNQSTCGGTVPAKYTVVSVDVEKPSGWPVFGELAIYQLSGMLGTAVKPQFDQFPNATDPKPVDWFKEHRAVKADLTRTLLDVKNGPVAPWCVSKGSFAVMLGAAGGSHTDDGFTSNFKTVVMITSEGAIMIAGLGDILSERKDIDQSYSAPFETVILFEPKKKKVVANLAARLKKPANSGDFVDLDALAEIYVSWAPNQKKWYVHFGDQARPIRAELAAHLFQSSAYLMIDPPSVSFGANAGYDSGDGWHFGPLSVHLEAAMTVGLSIQRNPTHAQGSIQMGGNVELSACGAELGINVNVGLAAEMPIPLKIEGSVEVTLELPLLPDISATVDFIWEKPAPVPPPGQLLADVRMDDPYSAAAISVPWSAASSLTALAVTDLCIPAAPVSGCKAPWVPFTHMPEVAFNYALNTSSALSPRVSLFDISRDGSTYQKVDNSRYWTFKFDDYSLKAGTTLSLTSSAMLPLTDTFGSRHVAFDGEASESPTSAALFVRTEFAKSMKRPYLYYINIGTPSAPVFDWDAGILDAGADTCPLPKAIPEQYARWVDILTKLIPVIDLVLSGADDMVTTMFSLLQDLFGGSVDSFFDVPVSAQFHTMVELVRTYMINFLEMIYTALPTNPDCNDPGDLTESAPILPPGRVVTLDIKTQSVGNGVSGGSCAGTCTDRAAFYTSRQPFELAPFVYETVPNTVERPLYRSYFPGVRTNTTYLKLVYHPDASSAAQQRREQHQRLVFRFVDRDGRPAGHPGKLPETIVTKWYEAQGQTGVREDDPLLDHMAADGKDARAPASRGDDVAYGKIVDSSALVPETQYLAEIWDVDPGNMGDPRLFKDTNGTPNTDWLNANPLRGRRDDKSAIQVFSFPFRMSKFMSFREAIQRREPGYWAIDVDPTKFNNMMSLIQTAAARSDFLRTAPLLQHSDPLAIGRSLMLSHPGVSPDDVNTSALRNMLRGVVNYGANPKQMTDDEAEAIRGAWSEDLPLFETIDRELELTRNREPATPFVEVTALRLADSAGGNTPQIVGFVVDLAEQTYWERIRFGLTLHTWPWSLNLDMNNLALIYDRTGRRLMIFRNDGAPFAVDDYTFSFTLQQKDFDGKSFAPIFEDDDGSSVEEYAFSVNLSVPPNAREELVQ